MLYDLHTLPLHSHCQLRKHGSVSYISLEVLLWLRTSATPHMTSTVPSIQKHVELLQTNHPPLAYHASAHLQKTKPQRKLTGTMPIPLFTSEKPSNAETALPSTATAANTSSASPASEAASALSEAARDERDRTAARRRSSMSSEEAARLYEERIEEEYAKREGGA
jgi:hypothetical protein